MFILDIWHACLQVLHQMSQYPIPSEIVVIEKSVSLLPQKGHSPEFLSDKILLKFCIQFMFYTFFKNVIINAFKMISLFFHFLQMLLCIFFAVFFQLLYMALLMDNCSYKLFFVGIFNSKNLPIFLLRRFMPLFIIALSTLEVNDFQPIFSGITGAHKFVLRSCLVGKIGKHFFFKLPLSIKNSSENVPYFWNCFVFTLLKNCAMLFAGGENRCL